MKLPNYYSLTDTQFLIPILTINFIVKNHIRLLKKSTLVGI